MEALSFAGLRVQAGRRTLLALENLSAHLEPGHVLGVAGGNGSGKTTLLNVLGGFVRQAAGSVTLLEEVVDPLPPWHRARRGMGRLWQDLRLFEEEGALGNVIVALQIPRSERLWAQVLAPVRVARDARHAAEVAGEALSEIDVLRTPQGSVAELSHGQRKWVALVRASVPRRPVLLLDEPASGLDADGRAAVVRYVLALRRAGTALVIVEHDVGFLKLVADTALVLDRGQCADVGDAAKVLAAYSRSRSLSDR